MMTMGTIGGFTLAAREVSRAAVYNEKADGSWYARGCNDDYYVEAWSLKELKSVVRRDGVELVHKDI